MKTKPTKLTKKTIKGAMKYEQLPEDKQRRKALATKEIRQVFKNHNRTRRFNSLVHGLAVLHLFIRKDIQMYAIVIYSVALWFSGFMAANGMRFESLLTLVAGVILAAMVASINNEIEE